MTSRSLTPRRGSWVARASPKRSRFPWATRMPPPAPNFDDPRGGERAQSVAGSHSAHPELLRKRRLRAQELAALDLSREKRLANLAGDAAGKRRRAHQGEAVFLQIGL